MNKSIAPAGEPVSQMKNARYWLRRSFTVLWAVAVGTILAMSCDEEGGLSGGGGGTVNGKKLPDSMVYSYECLGEAANSEVVTTIQKGEDKLRKYGDLLLRVSDEDQMKYGDEMLAEMKADKTVKFDDADPVNKKLQSILDDLLRVRPEPSGIKYSIFLLRDEETVNAFTAGGKIFVTTAMVKKCRDDDQLYAIIGHEIGHNEKGHIKASIREAKVSEKVFGEYSDAYLSLKQIAGAVFNQHAEVEADYYGIGMLYLLDRKPCSIISFWKEMAAEENEYSKLEDFLRSHPFSAQRAECIRRHVKQNFGMSCT